MSLNISEVKNGRIYSVVFEGPVNMNKGGRMGVPLNPLLDLDVEQRLVQSIQACSRESYVKRAVKLNPAYVPSGKSTGWTPTAHPCVDMNEAGECALRGVKVGVTDYKVTVGGKPATPEQLETIRAYQTGGKWFPRIATPSATPTVEFRMLKLDKIEHEGWSDDECE